MSSVLSKCDIMVLAQKHGTNFLSSSVLWVEISAFGGGRQVHTPDQPPITLGSTFETALILKNLCVAQSDLENHLKILSNFEFFAQKF